MRRFLGLVFAVLGATVLVATPAQATFPGKNGKLVGETSYRVATRGDVQHYLFTINPDGSGRTVLDSHQSGAGLYSPDGSKIAFQRGLPGGCCFYTPDLLTMNADGSSVFKVAGADSPPPLVKIGLLGWSPDGTRLLLSNTLCHRSPNCGGGLLSIQANGSGLVQVVPEGDVSTGAWSPDSTRVAYVSSGDAGLYVVSATGGAPRRLTTGLGEVTPAWSPDATHIAYSGRDGLAKINTDGTRETQLTHFGAVYSISWSHGGSDILFAAPGGIYKIKPDGSRLTRLSVSQSSPIWSPDDRQIAFTAPCCDGPRTAHGIWVMRADGSDLRLVSDSPANDAVTDWQPIPGPKRSDYKNANKFCKAEQRFWGNRFKQRYGNFGKCVSSN
jgi:Tol biopolymer transport system component